MNFQYRHPFSGEVARERLIALGEYLTNRHKINVSWDDNRGTFSGRYLAIKFQGQLEVNDDAVEVSGKDPGLLLRKKATNYLKGKLEKYLDPDTPITELPRR